MSSKERRHSDTVLSPFFYCENSSHLEFLVECWTTLDDAVQGQTAALLDKVTQALHHL
jgi:hypothetical protein